MGYPLSVTDVKWSFSPHAEAFITIPSLQVEAGSVVALVGPSGAGKSTMLFLLAGMEEVPYGQLVWGGQDLAQMNSRQRDIWRRDTVGMVFQDFQLIPELSVLKNVLLPFTFSHFSIPEEKKQKAVELLRQLGIGRFHEKASTLSRGEMQRVSLARALMKEPQVMLADEPTASLDARNEEKVVELLLDMARGQGATLLIATHHQAVKDRADYVVEISHGRVMSCVANGGKK